MKLEPARYSAVRNIKLRLLAVASETQLRTLRCFRIIITLRKWFARPKSSRSDWWVSLGFLTRCGTSCWSNRPGGWWLLTSSWPPKFFIATARTCRSIQSKIKSSTGPSNSSAEESQLAKLIQFRRNLLFGKSSSRAIYSQQNCWQNTASTSFPTSITWKLPGSRPKSFPILNNQNTTSSSKKSRTATQAPQTPKQKLK